MTSGDWRLAGARAGGGVEAPELRGINIPDSKGLSYVKISYGHKAIAIKSLKANVVSLSAVSNGEVLW